MFLSLDIGSAGARWALLADGQVAFHGAVPPESFQAGAADFESQVRHGIGRHYHSIEGAGIAVPGMVDSRNNVMAHGSAVWAGGRPAPELHGQGPDRLLPELTGKLRRQGKSIRLFTGASASLAGCLREAEDADAEVAALLRLEARAAIGYFDGHRLYSNTWADFLRAGPDGGDRRCVAEALGEEEAGRAPACQEYTARLPAAVDALQEYLKRRGLPMPKVVHATGANADILPLSDPGFRRRSIRIHHRSQPLAWEGIRVLSEGGLRVE